MTRTCSGFLADRGKSQSSSGLADGPRRPLVYAPAVEGPLPPPLPATEPLTRREKQRSTQVTDDADELLATALDPEVDQRIAALPTNDSA